MGGASDPGSSTQILCPIAKDNGAGVKRNPEANHLVSLKAVERIKAAQDQEAKAATAKRYHSYGGLSRLLDLHRNLWSVRCSSSSMEPQSSSLGGCLPLLYSVFSTAQYNYIYQYNCTEYIFNCTFKLSICAESQRKTLQRTASRKD